MKKRLPKPAVLLIGGHDPTNGAGIGADLKVVHSLGCYGFTAISTLTIQTEDRFLSHEWLAIGSLRDQIKVILDNYVIDGVKIGVINLVKNGGDSESQLDSVFDLLSDYPDIPIIWDPVLRATADNFSFIGHDSDNNLFSLLASKLSKILLFTPNQNEIRLLKPNKTSEEGYAEVSASTFVLCKGLRKGDEILDYLVHNGTFKEIARNVFSSIDKHGTGCFLGAAILGYLVHANDEPKIALASAIKKASEYLARIRLNVVDSKLLIDE